MVRKCGVLLPVFSLPGPDCIGTLGAEAREFVDFLAKAGQSIWQVLPLTLPARGDSPYSACSVFAGNPYYISLEPLVEEGALENWECDALRRRSGGRVDYQAAKELKMPLLRKAFGMLYEKHKAQITRFRCRHAYWVEDFALFMAQKERAEAADAGPRGSQGGWMEKEVLFWVFTQYLFFSQWEALRRYAEWRGVTIMGDIPIYVDGESADVWSHPEIFQMDPETRRPLAVAGVPPDAFSEDGQFWGNPLYDWKALKKDNYRWWMERLKVSAQLYHSVRIDHFRGLAEYYSIPAGAKSAQEGRWRKGPGVDFIRQVKRLPCDFVAEDLGHLTPDVGKLLKASGFPGMKVLLFAFDPQADSTYLPHNLVRDCVAYIGTHDNNTVLGWMESAPPTHVRFATRYLRLNRREGYHWGFIRSLYASVADTAIVQMQDFLGLDDGARTNVPAVPEGNWSWRMEAGAADAALARKIRALVRLYGRRPT